MNVNRKLPISLKIAAGYLLISGLVGLAWPLFGFGPHHPEFEKQSFDEKVIAYAKQSLVDMAFVMSAVGLFMYKAWARILALYALVFGSIISSNSLAWGLAQGPPNFKIFLVSIIIVLTWNAIWFFLIYNRSSSKVLS